MTDASASPGVAAIFGPRRWARCPTSTAVASTAAAFVAAAFVAAAFVAAACLVVALPAAEPLAPPRYAWMPQAPPLPEPAGRILRVASVEELFRAAEQVEPGGTILLADGHYRMPRYFELRTDNVTLRGEAGRREQVVLDGAESRHGELVGITGCSGVTIAHLTLQNVRFNGLKINSNLHATRVTAYDCIFHNIWQRAIKGPAVEPVGRATFRPSDCRIQYCLFYNDRPKRFSDDPADTEDNFGGNYVGGIDAMFPRRWTVSDNVFTGIRGRTGEGRGAVFLWQDAQDCVVERNLLVDCDSGICLGNSYRPAEIEVHCRGCVVRNNFVVRCPQNGILADYTQDCRILHNSIHDPSPPLKRLIRLVHDNPGLVVANNLLSGPPPRIETRDAVRFSGNLSGDYAAHFRDADQGDLHLSAAAAGIVDAASAEPDATEDFDREPRGQQPDVGADEWPREPTESPH